MDDVSHIALNAANPTKALTLPEPLTLPEDGVIVIAGRRYLLPRRLAKMLNKSERTLLRWNEARCGPPRIKVGSQVLYDEEKLPEWLAAHEHQPLREQRRRRRGGGNVRPTA